MDAQELRNLQEAYMEVAMNEGLGGAPDPERVQRRLNQIDSDIKRGEEMYAKGEIPWQRQQKADQAQKFLKKHPRKKRNQQEQYDLYDIILSHLLDEGYADTQQAAEAIMVNMSEEWREDIVEAETGRGPRLIDAYDKPPYSDDVKDAAKYNPIRKGPKRKGVVKK
jgi:hypothetical protein